MTITALSMIATFFVVFIPASILCVQPWYLKHHAITITQKFERRYEEYYATTNFSAHVWPDRTVSVYYTIVAKGTNAGYTVDGRSVDILPNGTMKGGHPMSTSSM